MRAERRRLCVLLEIFVGQGVDVMQPVGCRC